MDRLNIMLSKDATLATKPNCQRSHGDLSITNPGTFSRVPYHSRNYSVCQWTEAEKADASILELESILDFRCLTSLWPLAVAFPPMSQIVGSFGGIAEYTGLNDACQSSGRN
jgi:hypothetical protein